ncbi:Transcription factor BOA15 [Cladobotryum mycophilum]|uniref:Transcription factor BOA15 n=1 Tax=Cladobotryum mycophilum TaxID=491253 RepID=A0ABR0T588_9HYPO
MFGRLGSSVELPSTLLPREISGLLFNSDGVLQTQAAESYFATVHKMLPIVSTRRFFQQISSNTEHNTDVLLILLCMRLLTQHNEDTGALYEKAKQCFYYMEGRGVISFRMVQATLLLSLYEAANAIYPAAFMTIGHCARLGHAIGIHDRRNSPQMFPNANSWTETEEICRTWWGVRVLDRYINMGVEKRPFTCEDAHPSDLLPMDESRWELGEQTATPSLAVSGDTSLPAPPFSRTCQATHLLSHVLSHLNTPQDSRNPQDYYKSALQLHDILSSFHSALSLELYNGGQDISIEYASAMGICLSACIALYETHTCADLDYPEGVGTQEQLTVQQLALQRLQVMGQSACEFASGLMTLQQQFDGTLQSPFVTECLYAAAKQFLWYIRETGKDELLAAVETLTSLLQVIGQKWHVASKFSFSILTPITMILINRCKMNTSKF